MLSAIAMIFTSNTNVFCSVLPSFWVVINTFKRDFCNIFRMTLTINSSSRLKNSLPRALKLSKSLWPKRTKSISTKHRIVPRSKHMLIRKRFRKMVRNSASKLWLNSAQRAQKPHQRPKITLSQKMSQKMNLRPTLKKITKMMILKTSHKL